LAVADALIGHKAVIQPFARLIQPQGGKTLHHVRASFPDCARCKHRRAADFGKAGGKCAVVQMRMGDQNRHKSRFANLVQNRLKMGIKIGAGVDQHRALWPIQQIAIGACARHRRWIVGAQAGDLRADLGDLAFALHADFPCGWAGASVARMHPRLKSLLPRSLFGRAVLILVLPVIVVQVTVSIAFIQRHFEAVTEQMTSGVAIEISALLDRVAKAPDMTTAQAAIAQLASDLQLQVSLPAEAVPAADSRGFLDYSGRRVILTLRARLGGVFAVDLTSNSALVQAYFDTKWGPVRVSLARTRVSATNPHQLLVWMVFTSGLMTFIAYIFLRNQLTPITRLALAAEAFGKGQTLPYSPRGATEVRAAGVAFLNMRARIERQIETRTLMLSGVSHDLRTPLTRLKLGLSFLPEDEETRALQQDVQDMERLVSEFLAFARGDAMEETELVDPATLAQRLVENARRMQQPVDLGQVQSPGAMKLRPQAVTRALENLLGNAVRYGKRAEVSVIFTDRSLRFVVEDDGPGIAADRRELALEPFERLDAARDPNKGGGVGLGLSIAADIARSHGGELRLSKSEALGGLRAELSLAR
jgi:two-component system, OmpR family, osmolarity sensor histidine kinase EnvZ